MGIGKGGRRKGLSVSLLACNIARVERGLVRGECFWVYLFFSSSFFFFDGIVREPSFVCECGVEGAVERESCGGGVVESSFL